MRLFYERCQYTSYGIGFSEKLVSKKHEDE